MKPIESSIRHLSVKAIVGGSGHTTYGTIRTTVVCHAHGFCVHSATKLLGARRLTKMEV